MLFVISNSNWTEWSTIQGEIARVISKLDEREARGRFEITSTISLSIVRHGVQLLITRIYNKSRNYNYPITAIQLQKVQTGHLQLDTHVIARRLRDK